MAFTFRCSCGWNSGECSSSDVGPKPTVRTCKSCGAEESEGPSYRFTPDDVASGAITCEGCGEAATILTIKVGSTKSFNAQVSEAEATAVAVHPETGEVVYCFGKPTDPMPDTYKSEGFVKHQFTSFHDLQRFCRATGQVNDIEGDWHKEDGFFEEDLAKRRKAEKEQVERYMDEREKVRQSHPELRRER